MAASGSFGADAMELGNHFAQTRIGKSFGDARLQGFDRLDNFLRIETAITGGAVLHWCLFDGPGEGGLEHRLVQGGRVAVIDHRSFWIDEYNVRDGRGANRGREPSFRIDGGGEFDFWLCERANVPL